MKKIFLTLITPLLLTACENELGPLSSPIPTQLIVNGLLTTTGSDNKIFLHLSGQEEVTNVTDGTVKIYINDQLAETITAEHNAEEGRLYKDFYPVKSTFHAGDRVKMEASAGNGAYQAWAETQVTTPPEVVRTDTTIVWRKPYYDATYTTRFIRLSLSLQEQNAGKKQYYRLQAGIRSTLEVMILETEKDSTYIFEDYSIVAYDDMALTDGHPQAPNEEGIGVIPQWQNYYKIFTNQYFTAGSYQMTFDMQYFLRDWSPEGTMMKKGKYNAFYRMIAISEEEYIYLRALEYYINTDDGAFNEPVKVPGNINGGLGIFAIENHEEGTIDLKRGRN